MAGIIVQGTALDAAGNPVPFAGVRVALVTGSSTTPGYTSAGEITATYQTSASQTGAWSITLAPNTSITPANTYYQVTEGTSAVSAIVVPATGGPYTVERLLVTPPPTPSAPGITGVQVAASGTVAGVRPEVNLIGGTGVGITAVDNASANRVDVTLTATGQGELLAANDLNDVANTATARTNLGLGTAAVLAAGTANGAATLDATALVPATQMRPFNYRGPVAANTAYNPWDVLIYQGNRILITTALTTGTGNPPTIPAADYIPMGPLDEFHASDYGIVGDGVTDNGPALNALILEVSVNGGGTIVLPPGDIMTSQTIIVRTSVHLRGAAWLTSAIKLLPNSNCDVVAFYTSPNGTTDPNAFFGGLWNLEIHGNSANQTPGTFNHGVNCTLNPTNVAASADPDFDPTHILCNVFIKLTTGDGYHHVGRSGVRLIGVWTQTTGGCGYYASFDTEFTDCHAQNAALAGFYLPHSSVRLTGCKSYNNGTAPVWASGSNYTAGQHVLYSGSLYIALNTLTGDTVAPSGDPTNWQPVSAAPAAAYGHGFYVDGSVAGYEIAMAGCDAQQNGQSGFYLKSCTGVSITGTVYQINTGLGTGTNQSTNPNNNAALVLDGATGNNISLAAQSLGPAGYVLRSINGATRNDLRLTGDTSAAATLSPDSTTLLGSGNSVSWNGATLTGTLAALKDVSISAPGTGQALAYNGTAWTNQSVLSYYGGTFGDGSDGAIAFNGTNTYPAIATLAGSTYTLRRDVYATSLTISAGVTVIPVSCRMFANGTFTNNGTIANVGASATSSTGGTGSANSVLGLGGTGGTGNTGAGGSGGSGGVGVASGGAGGAGSSGAAGGAGFAASSGTSMLKNPAPLLTGLLQWDAVTVSVKGGGGGGGGGGDAVNKGGGGGQGGGIVAILANAIVNNGSISVAGGAGFTPTTGNCGGGGGGGGGLIVTYSVSAVTGTGSTTVTGGAAGAGVGTGAAGTAGGNGLVLNQVLA